MREPGGGGCGDSLPPQPLSRGRGGGVPHLLTELERLGQTAVVPKLGVVGHKGNLSGRKLFSEKKIFRFIGSAAHILAEPQITFFSLKRPRDEK